MKLLIYLAVWKRPEITEICFMGINRLRRSGLFPIEAFAVISEESMIPLCIKYNIQYCFYKNEPLGEKKNYGLKCAMDLDWDYMIEIGSDDLLYDELLQVYAPHFGRRHIMGLCDFLIVNAEDLACRRIVTRSSYGLGRTISRHVVEKVGKIWNDDRHRGMDNHSLHNMMKAGFMEVRFSGSRPLAIDIKSAVNMWPFNYLIGQEYDFEEALKGLSIEECYALRHLPESVMSES